MFKKLRLFFYISIILLISCKKENFNECWVWQNGQFVFMEITKAAEYKDGGEDGYSRAILSSIRYPAEARANGIEGTVDLTYEISEQGIVENVIIVNDIGGGCGNAAKEAIEGVSESFNPAEINNTAVRVRKEIPVRFRLE